MEKILKLAHDFIIGVGDILSEIFKKPRYNDDMDLPMEEIMPKPKVETPQEMLLEASRQYVGEDASPQDDVDDALACAISVSKVIQCLYSDFPDITGTWTLNEYLQADNRFRATLELSPGNIWIFPTGTGNGIIRGHVFIVGEDGHFYSNSSFTGIWGHYYTKDEIIDRYVVRGGLKQYLYEPIYAPTVENPTT